MEVPNAVINTVKMVLMSTGVVFIAILLSLSLGSAAWDLPSLWSGIQGWLRPPYLYLIINGIIITIAASSRLHHNHNNHVSHVTPPPPFTEMESTAAPHAAPKQMMMQQHQQDVISVRGEPQFSPYDAVSMMAEVVNSATGSYYGVVSVQDVDVQVVGAEKVMEKKESEVVAEEEEEAMPVPVVDNVVVSGDGGDRSTTVNVERSKWSPLTRHQPLMDISPEFLSERPPASARFAHHRRPAKPSPVQGGKALRKVAKPKKHDTLECTWKTITEGRHMPLTRHLKKSDTWEAHGRQINLLDDSFPDPVPLPVKKKSETFNGWANHAPSAVPKLKKEPSLSQDELNRRVEAFINKFNEDMRLQRQQSMQQFMEKINRAAY